MRPFIAIFILCLIAGCAKDKPKSVAYVAPVGNASVQTAISEIKASVVQVATKVEKLKTSGAAPNDPIFVEIGTTVVNLDSKVARLESAQAAYVANVEHQTELLNEAATKLNQSVEETQYWKGKHFKGLKEIWIGRFIILGLLLWIFKDPLISTARRLILPV